METDLIAEDGMINDYEGLENIGLKFGGKKSADPGPFLYAENEILTESVSCWQLMPTRS